MAMWFRKLVRGCASAFDMGPAGYRQPAFLRAPRSDTEVLTQDWQTLYADGWPTESALPVGRTEGGGDGTECCGMVSGVVAGRGRDFEIKERQWRRF